LLTDDQRADCLSCAGHPLLKTPNVDKLAAKGVVFKNAFVTTAICCVSRASIVTGSVPARAMNGFATPLGAKELSGNPSDRSAGTLPVTMLARETQQIAVVTKAFLNTTPLPPAYRRWASFRSGWPAQDKQSAR